MTRTPNPQDDGGPYQLGDAMLRARQENTMDNKELIILAAKVAGIDHPGGEHSRYDDGRLWDCKGLRWWNPLGEDGDALRLAVACDMTVCADGLATVSACSGYGHDKVMVTQTVSECGKDKSAATRRAIVRAAAAIARQENSTGGIE